MNNNPQLLVIASYPPKGEKHSSAIVGGAMYAKNTFQAVMASAKRQGTTPEIIILAEAFKGHKETYTEDGVTVKRFWKRGSFSAYTSLLSEIRSHPEAKTVVIEFEFAMFGERLSLLPLPLFLILLRLMGKRVIFVFHQVVSHIGDMGGHLNIQEKGLMTSLMNFFLQGLYASLLFFSSQAIVFEEILKKRLAKVGNPKKISVVPFGTEVFTHQVSTKEARVKLGLPEQSFIVFVFGFLAWYKGTDWLVDVWGDNGNNMSPDDTSTETKSSRYNSNDITVILGGGGNPNHVNKPYYRDYIAKLKSEAEKKQIIVTDFIPEDNMPLYFQAADLVLLPYRTMMSSSGPLSLAFSFGKPFFLSDPLKPLFQTHDIHQALEKTGINPAQVTFPLNDSFSSRLTTLVEDTSLLKKITELSRTIAQGRSWESIGDQYYAIFFAHQLVNRKS